MIVYANIKYITLYILYMTDSICSKTFFYYSVYSNSFSNTKPKILTNPLKKTLNIKRWLISKDYYYLPVTKKYLINSSWSKSILFYPEIWRQVAINMGSMVHRCQSQCLCNSHEQSDKVDAAVPSLASAFKTRFKNKELSRLAVCAPFIKKAKTYP